MKIKFMSSNKTYVIERVGIFTPKPIDVKELSAGEIGFIITGIKTLQETKVGDTICEAVNPIDTPCQDLSQVSQLFSAVYFPWIVQNIKN